MGKRKRTGTAAADPLDSMPCSSGRDVTPEEEVLDSHGKHPSAQLSLGQHRYNLSRGMFSKRSRHHYGSHYSRLNLPNYNRPSTSYGKSTPFRDERLCFKLGNKYNSELGNPADFTEFREKAIWRPERIGTSSLVTDAVFPEAVKMVCGICQKSLRRKPHSFGDTLSSDKLSVVAVLVCGHIYHADCLEDRTSTEDIRDPPCPICSGSVPKADLNLEKG